MQFGFTYNVFDPYTPTLGMIFAYEEGGRSTINLIQILRQRIFKQLQIPCNYS